jgi:NNP family nitrate/nitrite transporter-like MFS transporter
MERYTNFRGKALLFLFFLWFIWFVNFSIRMVFSPILPIIEDEFMVNHAQASSIFIFLSGGYGTAVIISGLFSGKFGYKKTIIFSLALLSLKSRFLIIFSCSTFLLLCSVFLSAYICPLPFR